MRASVAVETRPIVHFKSRQLTQDQPDGWDTGAGAHGTIHRKGREAGEREIPIVETVQVGWRASCACDAGEPGPATVLDPFAGSGTALLVADRLGRNAIGIELNPEYVAMARRRVFGDAPLLTEVAE